MLRENARQYLKFSCGLLLCAVTGWAVAGAPKEEKPDAPAEPEKPWRPFPDLPEVLWFEGFEGVSNQCGKGSASEEQAFPPGKKSYKLGPSYKNVIMSGSFGKAKFPNGVNPAQINIQFMAWCDVLADFSVKFNSIKGGDYADKVVGPKPKQWGAINLKLGDARTLNRRALPEHIVNDFEITVTGRAGASAVCYIDDIIVTYMVKPEDVLGRVLVKQAKIAEVSRSADKDGFTFSEQSNELLKTAIKAANKHKKLKSVLVLSAQPGNGAEVVKALQTAMGKAKAIGFTFAEASAPDNSPTGGMDDMRTLLSYNLEKSGAEYAVLMISNADASKLGRNYDPIRICLDRALDLGCVPLVCMPPGGGKADNLISGLIRCCNELGVPWVDTSAVVKPVANGMDGAEVSAAGLDAVAVTAMAAFKHVDANLHRK